MNDRNAPVERHGVAEQIATVIGLLSTGYLILLILTSAAMTDGGSVMIHIWPPVVSGFVVGVLNAIQFKRRIPLAGIIISAAVILGAWLLRSVWVLHSSINTRGETVFTVDYSVLAVMLLSSVIGAVVGGCMRCGNDRPEQAPKS